MRCLKQKTKMYVEGERDVVGSEPMLSAAWKSGPQPLGWLASIGFMLQGQRHCAKDNHLSKKPTALSSKYRF
jgi:hypothetical protein